MNEFIKEQLQKVKLAQIPEYDDTTKVLNIPKSIAVKIDDVKVNQYYMLELNDCLLNPPEGFTLHINWNNNIIPEHKVMKCIILADMGKMLRVRGIGYDVKTNTDLDGMWTGWLPKESVKILMRLV